MTNIDNIIKELQKINADIPRCTNYLHQDRMIISSTKDKVQNSFEEQQSGQLLISSLCDSFQYVTEAENSLNNLGQEILNYISILIK